jgi:hypothetical protein
MNLKNHQPDDESELGLDRAIRAALTQPAPEGLKQRVMKTALGFAVDDPRESRSHFLERMLNMVQTHKRISVASAMAVAALAAGLALSIFLISPTGRAYALEETAQANNHVTSYHVRITPAISLGEAWVQLNPDGTPKQVRMDFQDPLFLMDGAKVSILSKEKSKVWFKDKKFLLLCPATDGLQRVSKMRQLADPKLVFERLQADKAAGKVDVETRQPARDDEPIVLTVTSRTDPDRKHVYEVNSRAKLVERITTYRRIGRNWEQASRQQYLEYNQPIDPKVFQLEVPQDATVFDQIDRKPGLVKGDLTEDEIARKVAREFFEALIAGDYDKAGLIYSSWPAEKLKEHLGEVKFLRIVQIGKPTPPGALMRALQAPETSLQVPAKVEVEIKGRREIRDYSAGVRALARQSDRRVIYGGI